MFDKNYLGHDLCLIDYSKYSCNKCKTTVWKFKDDNTYYIQIIGDIKKLNLTCNETIIKRIIE